MVVLARLIVLSLLVMLTGFSMVPTASADCHTTTLGCKDDKCSMKQSGDTRSEDECTIGRVKQLIAAGDPVPSSDSAAGWTASEDGRILFEFTWDTPDGKAPANQAPVTLTIELEDPRGIEWDGASSGTLTMDGSTVGPQRKDFAYVADDSPDTPTSSMTSSDTGAASTSSTSTSSTSTSSTSTSSTSTSSTTSSSNQSSSSTSVSASGSITLGPLRSGGGGHDILVPFTIIANAGAPDEERLTGTFHIEGKKEPGGFVDFVERNWPTLLLVLVLAIVIVLVVRSWMAKTQGVTMPRLS